jgi:hypothetical protein
VFDGLFRHGAGTAEVALGMTVLIAVLLAQVSSPDPYVLWKSPLADAPPGAVLKAVAPTFPNELLAEPGEDSVSLDVWLNESGLVRRSRATSGSPPAQVAAQIAVSRWLFQPLPGPSQTSPLQVTFIFHTVAADASEETLPTVFRAGPTVEVRAAALTRDE